MRPAPRACGTPATCSSVALPDAASTASANDASVGCSNSARTESSTRAARAPASRPARRAASGRRDGRSCRRRRRGRQPGSRRQISATPFLRRRRGGDEGLARAPSVGAGSAVRSSFPFGVSGSRSRTRQRGRNHEARAALLEERPQQRRRNSRRRRPRLGPERRRPRGVCRRARPRRRRRRSRRPRRARASTAWISPSSIRKPRIFTWSSMRPRNSRLAVRRAPRAVAAAVEAARPERVREEALGGELGPVEVAARHAGAADVELAGDARPGPARASPSSR